ASAVLRGIPTDELERMGRQATAFGTDRLSKIADLVVTALDDMTGATSPRLQLELLVARVLASAPARGGVAPAAPAVPAAATPAATPTVSVVPAPADDEVAPAPEQATTPTVEAPIPDPVVPSGPLTLGHVRDAWPEILQRLEPVSRSSWMI
ncbi:hypothetical protein ACC848_37465, partial [Rhizobium johnstonii]